jgi:hypothetical protein
MLTWAASACVNTRRRKSEQNKSVDLTSLNLKSACINFEMKSRK